MMPGPRIGAPYHPSTQGAYRFPLAAARLARYSAAQPRSPPRGHLGGGVDDLQIAWLMIGWLVAFWAGKDLQTRFVRWRELRRGE